MITNEQATICARAANASYGKPTVPGGYTPVETFDGFDPKTGFNAVLYQKDGTHEYIIAFTGTQPSTSQDVVADLALGMTQWDAKRDDVINYLKNNIDASKITFTGHSLGGALAQYATYDLINIFNDSGMDIPALDLVTFAALGGMDGLQQMHPGNFDPSIADYINNAAHFIGKSTDPSGMADYIDVVTRLGGGHFGGSGRP